MGGKFSFNILKKMVNRYNAENRALKFIEKEDISPAPRHTNIDTDRILEEKPYLKRELEEIHQKSETLSEYLKKVYLTSTSEGSELTPKRVESNRKLPVLQVKTLKNMFYEPEKPSPGRCTLSDIVEMMIKFQEDPKYWSANALAKHYQMDVTSVVHLLTYYSLFKHDDLQSLNEDREESEGDDTDTKKKIDFQVYTSLEKKPVKQIEGKK